MNDLTAVQVLLDFAVADPNTGSLVTDGLRLADACVKAAGVIDNATRSGRTNRPLHDDLLGRSWQKEVILGLAQAWRNDINQAVRQAAVESLQFVTRQHCFVLSVIAVALQEDAERLPLFCKPFQWRLTTWLDWSAHETSARRVIADDDPAMRVRAAETLERGSMLTGLLGVNWVEPLIAAMATDRESSVRCAAAKALKYVASRPAWIVGNRAIRMLQYDENGYSRSCISAELSKLGCLNRGTVIQLLVVLRNHADDLFECGGKSSNRASRAK